MDVLKALCCLGIVITVVDGQERCLDREYHKNYSGPEGDDFVTCLSWKDNACCTANMTHVLGLHEDRGLHSLHWDVCGNVSKACETFLRDAECFYHCEPSLRKFAHEVPNVGSIIKNVPVCSSHCDKWFDACRDDKTCVENWHGYFKKGVDHCPTDSQCKTFAEIYGSGEGLCNKILDVNYVYSTDTTNCMQMRFDPKKGNPNTKVRPVSSSKTNSRGAAAIVTTLSVLLLSLR